MPKQKRQQQHLRQTSARRRSYTMGGGQAQGEKYRPPFPMNLMQNQKLFWIIGGVVMIGGLFVAAFASSCNPNRDTAAGTPVPTVTPTPAPDGSQTPAASPTANARKFAAAEQVVEVTKKYTATIKTDKGDIVIELNNEKAPKTVNAFVFLAQKGFYDGLPFHRVVADFVVQGGDGGSGTPGFSTEEDQNDLKNTRGMVSMAKAGPVTSFTSQFFVNLKDNPALDQDQPPSQKRFYPFGKVTDASMSVVDKITQGDIMRSVTIKDEPK